MFVEASTMQQSVSVLVGQLLESKNCALRYRAVAESACQLVAVLAV